MKDKAAAITCLPVLLMIINMQMSIASKIGAQRLIITVEHRGYKWGIQVTLIGVVTKEPVTAKNSVECEHNNTFSSRGGEEGYIWS